MYRIEAIYDQPAYPIRPKCTGRIEVLAWGMDLDTARKVLPYYQKDYGPSTPHLVCVRIRLTPGHRAEATA